MPDDVNQQQVAPEISGLAPDSAQNIGSTADPSETQVMAEAAAQIKELAEQQRIPDVPAPPRQPHPMQAFLDRAEALYDKIPRGNTSEREAVAIVRDLLRDVVARTQ